MDTITDVAWFYSSLAQAAASIVGIVGAVFLTRLMDHRERMLKERRDLATQLGDYGLNTFAVWVTEYTDPAFLATQHTTPADDQALRHGAAALARLLRRRVEPGTLAAIEQRLGEYEQQASSAWAKGQLHQNAVHLSLLRRKVELFRAHALPRTLIVGWALLAWLSVFGVLLPLAVLPARPQWIISKGLILTCFAVGVLGFAAYLAYELVQLHRLGRFNWTKED
jgi:hypothetical protein